MEILFVKMKSGCLHAFLLCTVLACLTQVDAVDDIVKRKVGNVCQKDSDCPDNAFCHTFEDRGYCVCKDDYILRLYNATNRECIKEAKSIGDPCQVTLQCQPRLSINSVCLDGACQCKEGSHFDDGRCYETAIIGQRCMVTQNCYLGPDESFSNQVYCVRGLCQCNLLHSPKDGGTRCLKDAMLGDPCEDDEHCTGENTRCSSVCRCMEGHVLHPDENRCLKAATALNDPCEIEAQCTAALNGTTCMDQICRCQWGLHMVGSKCLVSKYLGQKCFSSEECLTDDNEPGQCVRGVCTCKGCNPRAGGAESSLRTSILLLLSAVFFYAVVHPAIL